MPSSRAKPDGLPEIVLALLRTLIGTLAALALFAAGPAAAYPTPRTASGAPDLQGVWSYASITTLERPEALKTLELTDAEATAFETQHGGVPDPARGGPVGQETSEWWDLGGKLGRVGGRARSSWIVDPPDGRLPYSPAGLAARGARQAAGGRNFDGPEIRPAAERCLMGLGGSSLPPLLNPSYNGLLQILETPRDVVIVTEMNVGPRIIPLGDARHEPGDAWSGHSVGRWDGDTLVVETTDFHAGTEWRAPSALYISRTGKVVERFTRTGPDELHYAFTVDDPATYSRVWRGEMVMRRSTKPMFEFACHEGNYSLPGILAGAREQERTPAAK